MKNIWLKIGLGAGGIFAVGMILTSLGPRATANA